MPRELRFTEYYVDLPDPRADPISGTGSTIFSSSPCVVISGADVPGLAQWHPQRGYLQPSTVAFGPGANLR